MTIEKNIFDSATTAENCQRNWDYSKLITQDHLDLLTYVATTMPTKQNQEYYQLVVSTDLELNNEIYKLAYFDKHKNPSYKNHYNTQVLAHILFMWCPFVNFNNRLGNYESTGRVSIGISAGAVALAANQLGYRSGFCGCFNQKEITKKLNFKLNLNKKNKIKFIEVGLGIGIPNLKYNSNKIIENDKVIKVKKQYHKNIKVYCI